MTTVVVPGQALATDKALAEGMPTEQELAQTVVPFPKTMNGKMICNTSADQPAMAPGHMIKFSVKHAPKPSFWSKLFPFQEKHSIIDDVSNEPFAGGMYFKEYKRPWSGHHFVLFDSQDQPLVEATHDKSKPLQRVYHIQGREPLHATDEPLYTTKNDITWYPWFKMFDIDDSHLYFRSLQVWNGRNYQPMMHVEPVVRHAKNKGVEETLPPKKWQHLVVDCGGDPTTAGNKNKKRIIYASLAKQHGEWKACLAPGTDVVAMLMVTALLDDMVGWFA